MITNIFWQYIPLVGAAQEFDAPEAAPAREAEVLDRRAILSRGKANQERTYALVTRRTILAWEKKRLQKSLKEFEALRRLLGVPYRPVRTLEGNVQLETTRS